jgi:DNA-binding response OmpR family regulator
MRVLIVEDEPRIAAYLKRGLEEQGYAVDSAFTGGEALEWAKTFTFDVIVLDIMLPELDGLTVCRQLRKRKCQTPVLMLTARGGLDDRVNGLDAGADDYLAKPFALKELLARVRALTRRAADVPKSPVMQLADLRVDTRTRRVTRGGRTIKLTSKAFAVLEYMLRSTDRVLTRTEIAEHVWNFDSVNQSNIVDVYIRNLRRSIDDPFETKLIHTIRGAGYRITTESTDDPA